jgi:hypothetical protein
MRTDTTIRTQGSSQSIISVLVTVLVLILLTAMAWPF